MKDNRMSAELYAVCRRDAATLVFRRKDCGMCSLSNGIGKIVELS